MQGTLAHDDQLQPSLRRLACSKGNIPDTYKTEWVAQNAVVVGDVKLDEGSSVWHGVTLRGD